MVQKRSLQSFQCSGCIGRQVTTSRFDIYYLLTSYLSLQEMNVLNLMNFLSYAKAGSDLRELMLEYTPLQTSWIYREDCWAQSVLDTVCKLVCVLLYEWII